VLAVSLASALENAASALPELSDAVRPANGDPEKLLANLDAAGAGRVLEWLLRHEPTAGAELAAAFLDAPEGGAPLLALRDVELPKEGRKVLRRVLHRLRSRGEDVSETPAPRVSRLAPLEDTLGGAFVSALDPSGARLVVLVEPHPSSGARLFEVVVDEARGVLDFHAFVTGRSKARSFLRELQVRDRWSVVEVPRSAAEALLARMAAPGSDRAAPPREFGAWRSRLATPEEGAKSPGELAREALDEAGHAGALERAVALVKEQEIGPWPPAVGTLEEMAAALKDAAEGRVIVSGAARLERIEGALADCVLRAFSEDRAREAAWRLRETAYVFWKREREGDARACLAAARAFEEQELERNAVARALVERMLGPALEALREEEDPSLLVKGEQPALITKP
jgi:hypothetical protein